MSDETTPPVTADGPVLCLCGNPDNCSCPPVERTVRLVIENAAPGGPAHTVIFDGRAYPVLGCKPDGDGMTETYELRQRPTALAGDPGDLPARMAEAMRVALVTWSEGTQHEHLANAALSVRWEHAAHLAARVGDAERRAEKAEGQLSALRDHNARWETEKARADQAERELRRALDHLMDDGDVNDLLRPAEAELERLRAELAEVKAERDTNFSLVGRLSTGGFACATQLELMTAERDALNACIRATCSAARIAREVGDHRKVVLLSDVERLLTVPELPPLSPPDGGQ